MKYIFILPTKRFVQNTLGLNPSVRYRALHTASTSEGDDFFLTENVNRLRHSIENYDGKLHVIFIRPYLTRKLVQSIALLKENCIPFSADYDDFLFPTNQIILKSSSIKEKQAIITLNESKKKYLSALKLFSNVTSSTQELARQIKNLHPESNITVISNKLPPLSIINKLRKLAWPKKEYELHYFSGTKSHQRDLSTIIEPLIKWLNIRDSHKLVLRGSIEIPKELKHHNVEIRPHCHYLALTRDLKNAFAAIAPLEDTLFNQCKSAIKFLESGQIGLPVIASNVGEYKEIGNGGPILAKNDEQWLDAMLRLSHDKAFWESESRRQQEGALAYGLSKEDISAFFVANQ